MFTNCTLRPLRPRLSYVSAHDANFMIRPSFIEMIQLRRLLSPKATQSNGLVHIRSLVEISSTSGPPGSHKGNRPNSPYVNQNRLRHTGKVAHINAGKITTTEKILHNVDLTDTVDLGYQQLQMTHDRIESEYGTENNLGFLQISRHETAQAAALQSFIDDIRPPIKRSFNLAAYVNSSETLQELVKLGVSLYDIENTNSTAAKELIMLDFRKDCLPYIRFLVGHGLKQNNLGRFISEFPDIFQVPLGDLEIRIKYLKSKGFTNMHIAKALNRSSAIISTNVKTIDYKLGEFQVEFSLPAANIRTIVSKYPTLIKLPGGQYKMINFALREEFGFEPHEVHVILEEQPKILDILRPVLLGRLELVHNQIGLSHETICKFPKLLTGPILDIRHRFLYLQKLNRNQFDSTKPLYVPPSALYNGGDEQFCQQYAKTSLEDYKLFLKFS